MRPGLAKPLAWLSRQGEKWVVGVVAAVYGGGHADREQVRTFARRGFVVVPQVVPQELLAQASRAIDELLGREPPPRQVRGHHFYSSRPPGPRHCERC